MDLQDSCFLPPSTCFRLKAYGDYWVGVDDSRNINLSKQQDKSCTFFLLPCRDARYILQLIPARPLDLLKHFAESHVQGHCHIDNPYKENVLGSIGESESGGSWCFRKQGRVIGIAQYAPEFNEEFCFSLEFGDHGGVALSSGIVNKGYWTLDSSGYLLFGAQSISRRETFQLHEFGCSGEAIESSWTSVAPVRINLRAHTGQYLCSAATVICAVAEAPCCCEEFLLDVNFPPLPSPWKPSDSITISGEDVQQARKYSDSFQSSYCKVRTGNGMFDWCAGDDGKLTTVQLNEAQACEQFTVSVLSHKRHPLVSISHHFCEDSADCACYVSVDPSSRVTCNKRRRGKWEEFVLELVNESRILIQSVHAYFIGNQEASMFVKASSLSRNLQINGANVAVWRLRAHGDSRYTLLAASSQRDQGDFYLYVDNRGVLMQSNEPKVHFPSITSLFEIKPIASSSIWSTEGLAQQSNATARIVGFSIKTVRKINGKQRYLSAEPNGMVRANALHISRWEIFQLLDVDGTASAVLPHEFSCVPAALHNVSARTPIASISDVQVGALGRRYASWLLDQGSMGGLPDNTNYLSGKPIESTKFLKKASQVAAMATLMGRCLPPRMPASLQELCINQFCVQASAEVTRLCDKFQESLAVSWVTERLVESCLGIPDDLSARILTCWSSRQHPETSCKSLPSTFSTHRDTFFRSNRNVRGPSYMRGHSFWESSDDGFYCHSCNQKGLLKMNPNINPAHHRYLEVQYAAQNGAAASTGFLWNLISFAGVSIMSAALLFHFFADRKKRRRLSGSIP